MSGKSLVKHFYTGIWQIVFGLIAIPLALIWMGLYYVGGISDNPVLLIVLTLIWFIAYVTIGGWAARMAVGRVR